VTKFKTSKSSSTGASSGVLLPDRAANAWAMGASVDDVPILSSLGRVVWVINTTTDALSPRMVRTYSGFWPRRLLHRRWSLRTCRSPVGQENRKVRNADHLISQETVAAPDRQQEQETLNGSSTGFKNQPNLPKFTKIRRIRWWLFFSKVGTVHAKIGTVPTKNGTVHPKFSEKIRIDQVRFFSTRQIFKHWSSVDQQGNI
jgi:hypothetical protein